jgi:hypothetical protein
VKVRKLLDRSNREFWLAQAIGYGVRLDCDPEAIGCRTDAPDGHAGDGMHILRR